MFSAVDVVRSVALCCYLWSKLFTFRS